MDSPLTQPCTQPLVPIINNGAAILRRQQLACVKPIHNNIHLVGSAQLLATGEDRCDKTASSGSRCRDPSPDLQQSCAPQPHLCVA